MKPTMRLILALGDLLALFAFVLVGQADHSTVSSTNPLLGALPNVISLGVPWYILAWLLGAFPKDAVTLPRLLGRSALAWVIAAPIGLVIRMFWLGHGGIPIPFLIVTLAAGGLFLLGWQLIFWLIFLRPQRKSRKGGPLRLEF